ncbi:PQQ-binding-like beta-propeller repeat protein [Streptomyces sp. NPDC018031]|uniref:PQQ-binding-like beta-propeller repeat protein n=1 Tax=Streptomyces sp. NPDC018031 TaxID=3365033 RepID=UPI003797F239
MPADRYLYVAGDTGSVQQLSAGSGTRLFDRDTELSPRGLVHHGFTLYVVGATDVEESAVVSVDTLGVADGWRFTTETELSTVVRAGDTVYTAGEGVVHALDDRGKHLWTHRTPWGHDDEVGQAGAYPAVRVVAGTVYATGRNRLYALHASSGEPRWEYRAADRAAAGPTTAPVVAAGVVYQAGGRLVHAVDARSGTAKWRFVTRGGAVCEPQVRDGMLYAGAGSLHALDVATGTARWRFTPSAGALTSFSAVGGGTAIAVCDDLLVAVDSRTGEERWRFTRPTPDAGPLSAPVAAQGRVYTAARSRPHLYGLDASTGEHLWTAGLRDVPDEEVPGRGPPVVSAGAVHVIAGGALHAVEA